MLTDRTKQLTRETLGNGVLRPMAFRWISNEEATGVYAYADDTDIRNIVIRNLEPGQENPEHSHPFTAHVMCVLDGEAEYVKGDETPVIIKVGDCVVVPRETVHLVRNNGSARFTYIIIVPWGVDGRKAQAAAREQHA